MIDFLMTLLWLPVLAACAYLLTLTLLSARVTPPPHSMRQLRFEVLVPAHDEAAVIARTLASLRRLDWPAEQLRIVVIADNCSDATAALAHAGGAEVIERRDPVRRGKGYALQLGFSRGCEEGWADAFVVIDADSEVSPNLLEALACRIEAGAGVLQAHYGVLNPHASWRTQLMTLAQTCFHVVRGRGRERLGVSAGLRGNGWCVTPRVLAAVPYAAFSLAEDVEYGITLGSKGYRVHYAEEGEVRGEMVTRSDAARSQRRRWEGGRQQLRAAHTLPLLRAALRGRSKVCLDLALDLLLPPLATLALCVAGLALLGAALDAPLWPALFCVLALTAHVGRGWQLSGLGLRGAGALARVPRFIVWKLIATAGAGAGRDWVRTQRETP